MCLFVCFGSIFHVAMSNYLIYNLVRKIVQWKLAEIIDQPNYFLFPTTFFSQDCECFQQASELWKSRVDSTESVRLSINFIILLFR